MQVAALESLGGAPMTAATQRLADIVALPVRGARTVQAWSRNEVDDWGRDGGLVERVTAASRLRWDVAVGGADRLPARAGALIVVNARRFALAPVFSALAIADTIERPVRFVGRPDVAPFGPLLQRLGGLLPIATELEAVLRAGELVVIGALPTRTNAASGTIDRHLVSAAVGAGVKVFPTAVLSLPSSRAARVEISEPLRARRRRGPLAELELADQAQQRIDELLAEMAGSLAAAPLDLLIERAGFR